MDVVANLPTDDLVSFLVPPSLTLSTVAARLCGDLGLPQSAQRHVLLEDAVTGTRLSDWETPLESLFPGKTKLALIVHVIDSPVALPLSVSRLRGGTPDLPSARSEAEADADASLSLDQGRPAAVAGRAHARAHAAPVAAATGSHVAGVHVPPVAQLAAVTRAARATTALLHAALPRVSDGAHAPAGAAAAPPLPPILSRDARVAAVRDFAAARAAAYAAAGFATAPAFDVAAASATRATAALADAAINGAGRATADAYLVVSGAAAAVRTQRALETRLRAATAALLDDALLAELLAAGGGGGGGGGGAPDGVASGGASSSTVVSGGGRHADAGDETRRGGEPAILTPPLRMDSELSPPASAAPQATAPAAPALSVPPTTTPNSGDAVAPCSRGGDADGAAASPTVRSTAPDAPAQAPLSPLLVAAGAFAVAACAVAAVLFLVRRRRPA